MCLLELKICLWNCHSIIFWPIKCKYISCQKYSLKIVTFSSCENIQVTSTCTHFTFPAFDMLLTPYYGLLMPLGLMTVKDWHLTYLIFWLVDVDGADDGEGFLSFMVERPGFVHLCFKPVANASMFALKRCWYAPEKGRKIKINQI